MLEDESYILRRYQELGENRPVLYRSWPYQFPVLIGQSLDGTRHYVRKSDDLWHYIQEERNGAKFELTVWGKWAATDYEIHKFENNMSGGSDYSRLRIATTEDFNGEI